LSILVVTYNSAEFVGLCLDSIFRNTTYPNIEIIAVDNASTDDTVQRIRAYGQDNRLRLFCLDENRGFASGNNFAMEQASGEYVMFLNPDTLVTAGWLENLLRHLRRDRTIGLLTAVTNFAGNEVKINVDYRNQREMETFAAYVAKTHFGESFDVRVAPLYCALMPKPVWDRVGALDERFKMGMFEDDDLAMRVRAAGFRVVAARDCFIHHFGQGSFSKLSDEEYGRIFERNRLAFEAKWNVSWEPHQPADGVRPAHDEERFVPSAFCNQGQRNQGLMRSGGPA
jgi:GT2 family glycosyltransferase